MIVTNSHGLIVTIIHCQLTREICFEHQRREMISDHQINNLSNEHGKIRHVSSKMNDM